MTSSSHHFVVFTTDRPNMGAVREATRPQHRAWLRDVHVHGVTVRVGGPTLESHSMTMNGTLLLVQAASLDKVMQFVQRDPYVQAGLFECVEVRPWSWTLGNPDDGT